MGLGPRCFLILGLLSLCVAAKVKPSAVIDTVKVKSSDVLHAIPLQAELRDLNATLKSLGNASGARADLLAQKVGRQI